MCFFFVFFFRFREIYEKHKGHLPKVSIPECLCPESAPHLSMSGTSCLDNDNVSYPRIPPDVAITGGGKVQSTILTLDVLPEFMNDGKNVSFQDISSLSTWFSAPGTEKFAVEIDLKEMIIVRILNVKYICMSIITFLVKSKTL